MRFTALFLYRTLLFFIVTPLAHYYIIDGIVYQAPDMASVLCARLSNAIAPLTEAINIGKSLLTFPLMNLLYFSARKHAKYEDGREARCDIRGVASESSEEENKNKKAPEDIPSTWFQVHLFFCDVYERI